MNKKQYFYNVHTSVGLIADIYTYNYTGEYDAVLAYSSFLAKVHNIYTIIEVNQFNLV